MTMGIVVVAFCAPLKLAATATATITSTLSAHQLARKSGRASNTAFQVTPVYLTHMVLPSM